MRHPLAEVMTDVQRRCENARVLEVDDENIALLVANHVATQKILMTVHKISGLVADQLLVPPNLLTQVLEIEVREDTAVICIVLLAQIRPAQHHSTEVIEMIVLDSHVVHIGQLVSNLPRDGRIATTLLV